jgi:hypothetical protein
MNYKLILFVVIILFIGANVLCSCCQYPVFDYLLGRGGSIMEGNENRDAGIPGSDTSVKEASKDAVNMIKKKQPMPDIVATTAASIDQTKNTGKTDSNEGFIPNLFNTGVNYASQIMNGSEPAPRQEVIPVKGAGAGKEGLALMGSDLNQVQNGDVAGMWVTKANSYASEFGYGIINNTGTAYTADEPLKNGELVIFAKNKFKPECCPAPYSSSTGCACMTPEQIHYLNTRGGNRTSDSGV